MVSPLLLRALTRPHRGTRPVGTCCASLHSSLPPRPSPATYPPTLVKEAEVVYSPMRVSHRTRGLFCALKDLGIIRLFTEASWYVCQHSRATRWIRSERTRAPNGATPGAVL